MCFSTSLVLKRPCTIYTFYDFENTAHIPSFTIYKNYVRCLQNCVKCIKTVEVFLILSKVFCSKYILE